MDCANCCEAFVGTYEGYYFTKGTDEIRLCRCCKVEYLMLGGLGWKLVENTKLTAKQIARIERIRAERAAKKAAPDCCHTCGDISDEYTCRDGKLYCDGCEAVRRNNIADWCGSLNVDDRDSPNVFPYKKCAFCHERSSCGNYTDDDQWQCESCDNKEVV